MLRASCVTIVHRRSTYIFDSALAIPIFWTQFYGAAMHSLAPTAPYEVPIATHRFRLISLIVINGFCILQRVQICGRPFVRVGCPRFECSLCCLFVIGSNSHISLCAYAFANHGAFVATDWRSSDGTVEAR